MSGEQLLQGNGSVSHKQAVDKATDEYKKYKARTLSTVEEDYLNSIKILEKKTDKKQWEHHRSGLVFPVYYEDFEGEAIRLLNENTVETVCLLSKLHEAKHHVNVKLDMDELDLTAAESKATYEEIKSYVAEHYDWMKVSNLYIAQVKAKYGIIERENYNRSEERRVGKECRSRWSPYH